MKTKNLIQIIFSLLLFCSFKLGAQSSTQGDSTGLPGDNFSLQGALEMFKKSASPEEFEKLINSEDNHVNNLDLNGDGEIDYIRVIDNSKGKMHAFVLQVPVSESENQDIAVIEMEKTGPSEATLQILGDEDIYGVQTIVEPQEESDMNSKDPMEPAKKGGPNQWYSRSTDAAIIFNVWPWPCVRFAYGPAYNPWISPWRWRMYPGYWHPWRPLGWSVFRPYHARYYPGYGFAEEHRLIRAHRIYAPVRATSGIVRVRHANCINHYRVSRSRTTEFGPRGRAQRTRMTRVRRR